MLSLLRQSLLTAAPRLPSAAPATAARFRLLPASPFAPHLHRTMTTRVRVGSTDLLNDGQMSVLQLARTEGCTTRKKRRLTGYLRRSAGVHLQEGSAVPEPGLGIQGLALQGPGPVLRDVEQVHALRRSARQGSSDRRRSPRLVSFAGPEERSRRICDRGSDHSGRSPSQNEYCTCKSDLLD